MKSGTKLCVLASGALAVAFAMAYSAPIWDIDTFWHLAWGRAIVEARTIPSTDVLGVYQRVADAARPALSASWLGQVLLYASVAPLGLAGVVVLRVALLLACVSLVWWRVRAAVSEVAVAMAAATLSGAVLLPFTGDRPQLFSFVAAAGCAALFDAFRRTGRTSFLVLLLPLVALWANLHGGAALWVPLAATAAPLLLVEPGARPLRGRLLPPAILLSSAGMALLSPAGLGTFRLALSIQQQGATRHSEYLSPFVLARDFGLPAPAFWLLALASAIAAVLLARGRSLAEAALLIILLALALRSWRYVPFLAACGTPWVASALWARLRRAGDLPERLRVVAGAAGLFGAVLWIAASASRPHPLLAPGRFPEASARFLSAQGGVPARVFNHIDFGGYLLWKTGASVRPWVDGRLLDPYHFAAYTNALWLTPQGTSFFEGTRFEYVLVPDVNPLTGERYPLAARLRVDPRWEAVVVEPAATLYRRSGPGRDPMTGARSPSPLVTSSDSR